jgi:ribonuclease P protein component
VSLPQRHRLRGQRPFDRLYRQGRRLHGDLMVLRLLQAQADLLLPSERHRTPSPWRCAVVVSGKVSKRSVRRNRLRRLLHAHLLRQAPSSSDPLWLLLSLKPEAGATAEPLLLEECTHLLRKAGLLHDPGSPP